MKKLQLILFFLTLLIIVSCSENISETINDTTIVTTTEEELPDEVKECGNPYVGNYKIIWCDEFDYEGKPNDKKWRYNEGGGGWGNQELQHYTSLERNAYVKDGYLTITALKEKYGNNDYTSARLLSKDSFLYGRVEIKARLPKGRGTWPALWMLPTENIYGGWPSSGEIDIMEHVGYEENLIHGTIHTERFNHMRGTQRGNSIRVNDATSAYHVYAVEWEERKLTFYVDDIEYFSYSLDDIKDVGLETYDEWPFDQPFHIIMNIAIGGSWGGARGVDPNLTKAEMSIDYVRVYQKNFNMNDKIAPTTPQIITEDTFIKPLSAIFKWYPSYDNIQVKHYNLYLNDELIDTTTFTNYHFTDLHPNTEYIVSISAEDYAGNKSKKVDINFITPSLEKIPGKVEAENFIEISSGSIRKIDDNLTVVSDLKKNDYLILAFDCLESGEYEVSFRVSSFHHDSGIAIYTVDKTGKNLEYYGRTDFPSTGGYDKWETFTFDSKISFNKGINYIKIFARSDRPSDVFWLDWLEFKKE